MQTQNGGDGGAVKLFGGEAKGQSKNRDPGGMIHAEGGIAAQSTGGKIEIYSGQGTASSSGDIDIQTASSGTLGVSGSINLQTGPATYGNSGSASMITGFSKGGIGGNISLSVGGGYKGNGGNVSIVAGDTIANYATGGNVFVAAGTGVSRLKSGGGKGGSVQVAGGDAYGGNENDYGNVTIFNVFEFDDCNTSDMRFLIMLQAELSRFKAGNRLLVPVEALISLLAKERKLRVEASIFQPLILATVDLVGR